MSSNYYCLQSFINVLAELAFGLISIVNDVLECKCNYVICTKHLFECMKTVLHDSIIVVNHYHVILSQEVVELCS